MSTVSRSPSSPMIILTPPPTPNGRLHIGHISGPYLRADLHSRLMRFVSGRPVQHLSHIDTYQSYVPKKAAQLGRDVNEFFEDVQAGIKHDFKSFGIDHDLFIDNTSTQYLAFLDSAVEHLIPRLNLETAKAKHCSKCDSSLYEANVKGFCSHCLHDAFLNVCENCCIPLAFEKAIAPVCDTCGHADHVLSEKEVQFLAITAKEVERIAEVVDTLHSGNRRIDSMFQHLKAHRIGFSYDAAYGVFPKTMQGALNPWIEIYFGHLYSVLKACNVDTSVGFAESVRRLNALEHPPEVVAYFGIDNSYYYAFLFPYLSMVLGITAMVPTALKASFFLFLNNAKISSSRNNVIWAADLLKEGELKRLRTNLADSCPEFATKGYAESHSRAPVSGGEPAGGADTTPYASVGAFKQRLSAMTDARAFSVEELLNVINKAGSYSAHLKTVARPQEAAAIDGFLEALLDALSLG
ncbi:MULTISPECIES: class I tRNA ligase family protein [unclassified Pseudomonas]|uniref:class I tRNA ligase family protein n=1 Tax=unclassified Pseudomonas TaxID=196821 RepID=UPI000A1DBE5B|nr:MULTISPECIES: class I tRNA ligase family protein [unclassified Pseudomonas]